MTITSGEARCVLGEMGIKLPSKVRLDELSNVLRETPRLNAKQVDEFYKKSQSIKKAIKMEDVKVKVLGRISNKMLNLYKEVLDVNESDVIFFCDYSEFDIPVGHCFTQVVKSDNTILSCKVLLKSVSQQFLKPFDEIPHGWKTISKFEFVDGIIPYEVQMLPVLDDWIYTEKHLVFQ